MNHLTKVRFRFELALFLMCVCGSPCHGGEKRGIIEGFVHDEDGQPVRGAWVWIRSADEKTAADTLIVPISTKNTVGVVGAKFPPSTIPKWITSAGTDKLGHYKFHVPAAYQTYIMNSQCCHSTFWAQAVSRSLYFTVTIKPGQKFDQNFVVEKKLLDEVIPPPGKD
jgi:protocatechuate 3,4-dioxygenase beta subunit